MKIAYVHTGFWPSPSPSITFTTFNAISLAEAGVQCHFFIKRNSSQESKKIIREYFNVQAPQNLAVHACKVSRVFSSNFFYFKQVMGMLRQLQRGHKFDVVVSRAHGFLPYLVRLHREFGIPVLFESHDFYADLSCRDDVRSSVMFRNQKLEREYIPQVTGIICLQNCQKDLYEKYFSGVRTFLARTGLYCVKQQTDHIQNKDQVGYIGSLERRKGIETLFKALAQSQTKPRVLVIGGKNNKEIKSCRALADQWYASSKVEITGWVNKSELERNLAKIIIGILPLKDTFFNRYLTSPLKLFDFYSCGIPVVCPDLPTLRELVQENITGLFFQPDNPADLADKIDCLMTRPEKIKAMTENVYNVAGQLLWSKRAEIIMGIVAQLGAPQ